MEQDICSGPFFLSICDSLWSLVIVHRSARTDDPLQHIVTFVAFLPSWTLSPSCPCGRGLGLQPEFQGIMHNHSRSPTRGLRSAPNSFWDSTFVDRTAITVRKEASLPTSGCWKPFSQVEIDTCLSEPSRTRSTVHN